MVFLIVLVAILILVVVFFLVLAKAGGGRFPWIQFYTKGKESGFNFHEINLLRKVAVENKLENPTSLFWSIKQLDRSVKGIIIRLRAKGGEDNPSDALFLSKLFDFRKRVELALPRYNLGIKSTRNIAAHQKMRINLPGAGNFFTSVVENTRRYLAISYPEGGKLPMGFNWKTRRINVYFWRHEDAGYFYQTRVLEDFSEKKYPILYIAHSDSIIRSQKRKSIRVDVNMPARVFPLKSINEANELLEESPGLKSRLINISEDGAAFLVGGRAKVGLAVKLQFYMSDDMLVMCGIVKGVTFDQKRNQSVLHLQAVPPSYKIKNKILMFVYNIFQDQSAVKDPLVQKAVKPAQAGNLPPVEG